MRLSIVHDYLIQMGGAERVVAVMAEAFPDAPIYTSATDRKKLFPEFGSRAIINTWLNAMPGITSHFKKYFAVYPFAFGSLKPLDSEIAWISSSGYAKGIRMSGSTKSICYCHTPPRFFWNPNDYIDIEIPNRLVRMAALKLIPLLRDWDYRCAQKIDQFVANSLCVQDRIAECYGRDSVVIHPPVDVHRFSHLEKAEGYYLILSRLVGYKRIDRAIEAFNKLGDRLVIVGDGPDRERLKNMAGSNIEFAGRVGDEKTKEFLEKARGYIFPGTEDFGIVAVEAQACGRPVIAFAGGGALETVIPNETGILFSDPTPEGLAEAVRQSQMINWDADVIRANALRFDKEVFLRKMRTLMESVLESENGVEIQENGRELMPAI